MCKICSPNYRTNVQCGHDLYCGQVWSRVKSFLSTALVVSHNQAYCTVYRNNTSPYIELPYLNALTYIDIRL